MKALALFGSTARHDTDFNSDIDLLGVYDGDKIKSIIIGNVSLFLYPEKTIIEKMQSGDLFALHLVKESIPIYGDDILDRIYSQFQYKENYMSDVSNAISLAKNILSIYESIKFKKNANKKLAWCLRTIIIALSAQKKEPVFSKKKLSEYIEIPKVSAHELLTMINFKTFGGSIPKRFIYYFYDVVEFLEKHQKLEPDTNSKSNYFIEKLMNELKNNSY
ncbi:nucleotidyltransferase domain-containing protein [Aeromonas hydrophila]|uniref:nucleotidyltransferase domain-containing protein n=1 Tax=Aeromonas hydrophila TaxID=644 RepID=UPI003EC58C61